MSWNTIPPSVYHAARRRQAKNTGRLAAKQLKAMQAVMLHLDGFNDRQIGEWQGVTRANVHRIRHYSDYPLRIAAVLTAIRNDARL